MISFEYGEDDLQSSLHDYFQNLKSQEDFGISDVELDMIHAVDYHFFEDWNMRISDQQVQKIGFDNVEDFKHVFIIAHVYYNTMECGHQTLESMLLYCYHKVKHMFPDAVMTPPPDTGDVVDYLHSFNVDHLLYLGLHP